eukprot:COSAG01_NODE_13180_length_1624_cov_2.019672_2_plen_72_part_00
MRPRLPCGIVVTPCGRAAACRAIAGDRLGGEPQQWGGDVGGCDDDDDDDDDEDDDDDDDDDDEDNVDGDDV